MRNRIIGNSSLFYSLFKLLVLSSLPLDAESFARLFRDLESNHNQQNENCKS